MCTSKEDEACNFYLKPHGKYFVIATDPEDTRGNKVFDENHDTEKKKTEEEKDEKLPQRYIKMAKGEFLTPELFISETKLFYFKLRSPEDKKLSRSLPDSRWLPEASGGSQPYFIQPKGERPIFEKKKFFYANGAGKPVRVGKYPNDSCSDELQGLFILTHGYKT